MQPLLTKKQLLVLRYFRDFRAEHGISPTLEEAAAALGVTKITVHEHVRNLEEKGAVRRDPMKARAVAILYDPDAPDDTRAVESRDRTAQEREPLRSDAKQDALEESPVSDFDAFTAAEESPSLPLLGRIAAGAPIEAIEHSERMTLSDLVPHGDDHYLLQVRGSSMIEDHIADGDFVVIRRTRSARNGDVVVAIVDDEEATLKRFYNEGDRIRLQPANNEMDPIYPERCEIRGILRGVVRRWS